MTLETLEQHRLRNWCQDGKHNIPDPDAAVAFIDKVGICPLYKASSEFPNLFHGHLSDPNAKADSGWGTVSGEIYTWRWKIGKTDRAFYAAVIDKKPTWISWPLLPHCLAALMERRTPDELFDLGMISQAAHKMATVLDEAGGLLSTKELRAQAGFPTGKENRKAYLKAVEELESFFLLAKKMAPGEDSDDMSHALIPSFYRSQTERALAMTREEGLAQLIRVYIAGAAYLKPVPFAKALKLPRELLLDTLTALSHSGVLLQLEEQGQPIFFDSKLEK